VLPATPQTIDPRLLADIKTAEDDKHVEGTDFVAYRDSRGFWTIGYGHLLDQTIDWTGHTITQSTADGLLTADILSRTAQVDTLPEWGALDSACRRNALTECVFNLGYGHWVSEFPLTRKALEAAQWTQAATNLLHSPEWVKEVGLKRVARLADYFQNGSYTQ
jgi:GH24 family phage-related lysozyme (muramidase)